MIKIDGPHAIDMTPKHPVLNMQKTYKPLVRCTCTQTNKYVHMGTIVCFFYAKELSPGHVMLIQLDDTSLVVVTGLHRTDKPRMFAHPWGTIEQRGANTRGP